MALFGNATSRFVLLVYAILAAVLASSVPPPLPSADGPKGRGNSTGCCARLERSLKGKISFPGDDVYEAQQNGSGTVGYWSLQESELDPACRVTPESPADVATAVRILVHRSCSFAVRGGGHTAWAGAANVGPEGVTIDLSNFNHVNLNADRTVASIGPGARWGDVYLALDNNGVAVSGGRVSSVGVGGLSLGGGKSFFTAQQGFVCDNVLNYEIVTADGQVLDANDTSHPDLFKALKGGSGNFGVVTRFDVRIFKQGKLWAGSIVYPASTLEKQLETLYDFTEASSKSTDEAESEVIWAFVIDAKGDRFISNFYSHTAPEVNPDIFHNFTGIQPQLASTMRISNLTDFAIELNEGTPNGQRYLFATATFVNDVELLEEVVQLANETYQPLVEAKTQGVLFSTVFQPLTKPMLAHGCGKNSLGLCPGDGNLMILDITISWADAADDDKIHAAAMALVAGTTSRAKARGLYNPYIYLNYAAEWQQPIASYGNASVAELEAASRRYDPTRAIQRLVGGQKLPSRQRRGNVG